MACPASCPSGRTELAQVLNLLTAEPTSSLLCSRPGPEGHCDSHRDWPHIGRSVGLSVLVKCWTEGHEPSEPAPSAPAADSWRDVCSVRA